MLDHVRVFNGNGTDGGGLANHNGVMTVRHSLIDANEANQGAGILNYGGDGAPGRLTVSDSTIAGNIAGYRSGGISSDGNPANTTRLERVTITRNTAGDGTPGGIRADPNTGGVLRVQGSIIAANTSFSEESNCEGTVSEGGNVSSGLDCALTAAGDLQGVDPQLSTQLVRGVYEPSLGSPAVDRFVCQGADQRDVARPQGAACDAGAAEVDQLPDTVLVGDAPAFTFASPEPGVTFECALAGITGFAACISPYSTAGLAPGTYTLLVRAVDAAGQPDPTPAARTFTIAAQPPAPTPTAIPTPTPTPEFGETVVVRPVSGTVRVRVRGSSRFVELEAGASIPLGSTVDTKKGAVELTSLPSRSGQPQTAKFFDGIFRIGQAKGYTELRLTEPLAPCPRGKASAAATKPKTRKLWGDGKGKFRTRGQYSAATVRGTKWLVQDGCRYTRTRVTQGVVTVRDDVKKKTIILRKGRMYTART